MPEMFGSTVKLSKYLPHLAQIWLILKLRGATALPAPMSRTPMHYNEAEEKLREFCILRHKFLYVENTSYFDLTFPSLNFSH